MATGAVNGQRQAVPVRHRPSIDEMTGPQVEALRDAFAALQELGDDRGYTHHAGYHGLPEPKECDRAHGLPSFLPWHRAYLYRFEQALRDTGHDVMLPWWDWTKTREVPRVYAEEQRADGTPNPLFSVRISDLALEQGLGPRNSKRTRRLAGIPDTVREPEGWETHLPSAERIDSVMEESEYEVFRDLLESDHGDVHMWVGGHMADIPFAGFDPIFWAHHCMIDRLWRIWQLKYPQASFPAAIRDRPLEPFNLTSADVLDPTGLGYDYAIAIAQVQPREA